MTKQFPTPFLVLCAALGVACGSDKLFEPDPTPGITALQVSPTGAIILQGGSANLDATLTSSSGFTGTVNLTVTGAPTGVAAVVTNIQTTGFVTTATVTVSVSGSAVSGVYSLVVHATATGVTEATAAFALTVEPIVACPASGVCEQWALSATASSEYTTNAWSANQATGPPNAIPCEDDARAWASLESGGVEWLELVYEKSVRPTEIRIHEVFALSSIVKVEVKDGAGTYHTVHTAQAGRQTCPRVLIIPITGISEKVNAVRLSLDQRILDDWSEIDAVKLIGQQ